jgi:type 1 fimbria pilin
MYDVHAADGIFSLHGMLIAAPVCTVNDSTVDFGVINEKEIDGSSYKEKIDSAIECSSEASEGITLGLEAIGTQTSFDESAVLANIAGSASTELGVKLFIDGQPLALNKRVDIINTAPLLEAVPVKKSGFVLPPGSFTATVTLLVNYE